MKKTLPQTSMFDEIIVDNFAGGGGASTGIEFAERLKEDAPSYLVVIHFDAIDNIVKEMVGEQK